jgi:hypothetical protein
LGARRSRSLAISVESLAALKHPGDS